MLLGVENERIAQFGHDRISTFASAREAARNSSTGLFGTHATCLSKLIGLVPGDVTCTVLSCTVPSVRDVIRRQCRLSSDATRATRNVVSLWWYRPICCDSRSSPQFSPRRLSSAGHWRRSALPVWRGGRRGVTSGSAAGICASGQPACGVNGASAVRRWPRAGWRCCRRPATRR